MTNELLGVFGFLISSVFVGILSFKRPELAKILLIAFLARILFIIINNYVFTLPDGAFDAVKYERYGWEWSSNNQLFFEKFVGPATFFYSWIIGVVYEFLDRSILFIQFLSATTGVALVYVSWLLTRHLFGIKEAKKVAWIMALHPVILMYSALTMREVYISFFFVYSLYHFMLWYSQPEKRGMNFFKSCFLAIAAIFFHGAMVVLLAIIVFFYTYKKIKMSRTLSISRVFGLFFAILVILALVMLWYYDVRIPKLGSIESSVDPARWMSEIRHRTIGVSAYPEFLIAKEKLDLIWVVPIRLFYFMFSPFAWDVTNIRHFFGVADGLFYIYLFFYIYKNRSIIFNRTDVKILFGIMLIFIFIFSIGTGNSGSAVRHRSKFLPLILVFFSKAFCFKKRKRERAKEGG
jgi:hypothetical protein